MANDLTTLVDRLSTTLRDEAHNTWGTSELGDAITWAVAGLWPRFSRELAYANASITLVAETYSYSLPVGTMEVSRIDWRDTDGRLLGPLSAGSWETVGDPIAGTLAVRIAPVVADTGGTLYVLGYGRYTCATTTLATSANSDDIVDTAGPHGFSAGQPIKFLELTGGSSVVANTRYYVIATSLAAATFQFSSTFGGAAVDFGSDITAGIVTADSLIPDDLVPIVLATARAEMYRRMAGNRVAFEQWAARNQTQDTSVGELLGLINEADAEAIRLTRRSKTWRRPTSARHG